MAYEDEKNRNIAISVGVNATATLAAAQSVDDPTQTFIDNIDRVVGAVLEIYGVYTIQAAFPGTQVQSAPSSPVEAPTAATESTPAPQVVQDITNGTSASHFMTAGAPAAIPGVTDGDPQVAALWKDLISNKGGWFDNQFSNKNGFQKPDGTVVPPNMKKPSFKKKGQGDQPALWLNDKQNPSWVLQALAQAGIAVV